MDIGKKLRTLRIAKGYESINVAEKLGVSISTYRRFERNETTPDVNFLEKIAVFYDMELKDLLIEDSYTFYNHKNKGDNIGNVVINNLSEKIIELYEIRIKEKETLLQNEISINEALKAKIEELEKKLAKDK